MSHEPDGRIDRETAERMLRGDPVGPRGLASLLASAASPVSPGPLPGEREALAAFHRAEASRAPRPRRRIMIKLALAQLVASKAFAATAAAAAVGGVAAAAVTGTLPIPGHHEGTVVAAPSQGGEPSHAGRTEHPSGPTSGGPSEPGRTSTTPPEHSSPTGTPGPSTPPKTQPPSPVGYADLCRGLLSGQGGEVSVKLTWPVYAPLLAKGGGTKDGVVSYCVGLIGAPKPPTEHPTSPAPTSTEHPSPTPTSTESHEPTPTPTESHEPTPTPTESHPPTPGPAPASGDANPSPTPTSTRI
jgi:hypothetical protein